MSPEQEQQEARRAAAKRELAAVVNVIPFDLQTAGATRVNVWKTLRISALTLLKRNPRDPSAYETLTRQLRACGEAPVESLVEGVYKDKR